MCFRNKAYEKTKKLLYIKSHNLSTLNAPNIFAKSNKYLEHTWILRLQPECITKYILAHES